MSDNMFKTIHECGLELVAHTTFPEDGVEEGGWDMGDWLPVSAARASFGNEDKTGKSKDVDRKLLRFLADHRHVSCFEHNYATFIVECPLFVRSQIMRHSSFKFNEISRRYTSEKIGFWIPDKWRKQSKNNKQASTDEEVPDDLSSYKLFCEDAKSFYDMYCDGGVAREQARAILPQSLLTRFFMTGNLRSYWSFLSSRLKDDTQYETRVVAGRIRDALLRLWPENMGALFPNE